MTIEGYLWVAVVLGSWICTEINVLTSNQTRFGCQLLGETQFSIYYFCYYISLSGICFQHRPVAHGWGCIFLGHPAEHIICHFLNKFHWVPSSNIKQYQALSSTIKLHKASSSTIKNHQTPSSAIKVWWK